MKHQSITDVMFHANDSMGHCVAWGSIAGGFMLANARDGLIDTHVSLGRALHEMANLTGRMEQSFTVTENPHMVG